MLAALSGGAAGLSRRHVAMVLCPGIDLAEAVGEEGLKRNILLPDEAALRESSVGEQSSTVQMPAAVVIWMALRVTPSTRPL
jgi:hypothetical protein